MGHDGEKKGRHVGGPLHSLEKAIESVKSSRMTSLKRRLASREAQKEIIVREIRDLQEKLKELRDEAE
jgi:hypothetical protein